MQEEQSTHQQSKALLTKDISYRLLFQTLTMIFGQNGLVNDNLVHELVEPIISHQCVAFVVLVTPGVLYSPAGRLLYRTIKC